MSFVFSAMEEAVSLALSVTGLPGRMGVVGLAMIFLLLKRTVLRPMDEAQPSGSCINLSLETGPGPLPVSEYPIREQELCQAWEYIMAKKRREKGWNQ